MEFDSTPFKPAMKLGGVAFLSRSQTEAPSNAHLELLVSATYVCKSFVRPDVCKHCLPVVEQRCTCRND